MQKSGKAIYLGGQQLKKSVNAAKTDGPIGTKFGI